MGGLDERQVRFVDQIVAACEDIDRLVDDLSLLGRIGDGRLRPQLATVPLAEIAARAADTAPPSTDGRRARLGETRTEGVVEADGELVGRTIGRLAGIALRMDAAGPATTVTAVDGGVELAPIGAVAAAELTGRERDLALAAARAALVALGWELEVADGRAVVRPG